MIYLRLYPFTEMPFHLAAATIFKYFYSPGNEFSHYYILPGIIKSNIFHLIFTSLPIFSNVELGNKIFFILYVLIFPLSIIYFIYKTGGNIWFSLFSFAFLYNHNCSWGFVDFTFSTPVVIFFSALCYDYFQNKKEKLYPLLFILVFIIFFMHFQNAIFSVSIFSLFAVFNFKKEIKFLLKSFLFILPVTVLMVFVYQLDTQPHYENITEYLVKYYSDTFFVNYFDRLWNIPILDNFHLTENYVSGTISFVIFILILSPVILNGIFKLLKKTNKTTLNKNILVLFFAAVICYFILPNDIPGQNMIYQRYTVYLMVSVIIIASHSNISASIKKYYYALTIILLLIHFTLVSFYFYDFQKENEEFTPEIFPEPSVGKRLFGLINENKYKGRPIYIHFPYYYTIWKQGISGGIVDYRFGFIKRKTETNYELLPYYKEWVGDNKNYDNEYINMEYILSRDISKSEVDSFYSIRDLKYWYLFENKKLKK